MARERKGNDIPVLNKDASLSTLSIWAKELRRKGNYAEAENYYSRVSSRLHFSDFQALAKIEASRNELPTTWIMDVLEGRAVAREQMGRLEEALEDGNRMLKIEPTNPRGYICLGRLLETKKKTKSALKCYAYGISKCEQSHDAFEELVKSRNTLMTTLSDIEAVKLRRDPISTFPAEIISMVVSHLSLRDLLKCHRVNRQWRAILTSDHSLYQSLDLITPAEKRLNQQHIRALVRYSGGDIRSLKIRQPKENFVPSLVELDETSIVKYRKQSISLLLPLFKNLERLEVLRIESNPRTSLDLLSFPIFPHQSIRYLDINYYLHDKVVKYICETAKQLEYFGLSTNRLTTFPEGPVQAPSVKSLVIRMESHIQENLALVPFLNWFPSLEEFTLILEYVRIIPVTTWLLKLNLPWKNLKAARIRGTTHVKSLTINSSELRVLELSGFGYLPTPDIPLQISLEELTIDMTRLLHPKLLDQFLESARSLKKLTITSAPLFEARHIENFLREGINLTHVNINGLRYVHDGTLELLHHLKQLQRLNVDYCHGITGVGIIGVVENISSKRGGRLTSISIRGNESIRRQTMDWARNFGVTISI